MYAHVYVFFYILPMISLYIKKTKRNIPKHINSFTLLIPVSLQSFVDQKCISK